MLGVGCFKSDIVSQTGALYAPEDNHRADWFQFRHIGINADVILSPLICGTPDENVTWHWGLGAVGIATLIGIVAVWRCYGRHWREPDEIV